jgi:hypothetical protein
MKMKQPITVAELIALLNNYPPETLCFNFCEDPYYNDPLQAEDIKEGESVHYGAHGWTGTVEDTPGQKRVKVVHYDEGWLVDTAGADMDPNVPIIRRVKCLLIGPGQ